MLKVRQPYLCLQCHNTSGTIGNHNNIAFTGSTINPANTTTARQMLGNSCANCHMKVHGSNHPSGARLQR
jgi:hypothetical protein